MPDVDGLGYEERITTTTLLRTSLDIPADRITSPVGKRLKQCMTRLGWQYRPALRIDERIVSGYSRYRAADYPPICHLKGP